MQIDTCTHSHIWLAPCPRRSCATILGYSYLSTNLHALEYTGHWGQWYPWYHDTMLIYVGWDLALYPMGKKKKKKVSFLPLCQPQFHRTLPSVHHHHHLCALPGCREPSVRQEDPMLSWHPVGLSVLPPAFLWAHRGVRQPAARCVPYVDRAWPVWRQPLSTGLCCYISVSPQRSQAEPNRLFVVFPLLMDKKKAWEKSRDPRPSLRTAVYCLHGNEGNKTKSAQLLPPLPPSKSGFTKAEE